MPHTHHNSAFTIIELIVAVAIASMMMFFVNTLFNDTQRAIRLGIATGDALVTSESISNQLQADAEQLAPPNATNGGFLIIINKTYTADIPDPEQGRSNIYRSETIRSDQLIFIADTTTGGFDSVKSITPKNDDNFGNNITSTHARIWYGHVTPTDTDGTDASVTTPATGTSANEWYLGRQALLCGTAAALTDRLKILNSASDTYSVSFAPSTVVTNSGASLSPNSLYKGLTDLCGEQYVPATLFASAPFETDYLSKMTYAATRLRCNVTPAIGDFDSWRIAQTHPYLARNVSDFIVEFAAEADVTAVAGQPDTASGNIIWYGVGNLPTFNGNATISYNPVVTPAPPYDTNADTAFIFRYDDNGADSYWPYLIRIRYRVHDDAGQMRSTVGTGNTPTAGRWFEHIIKVNRP